jgi:hypothetical protein
VNRTPDRSSGPIRKLPLNPNGLTLPVILNVMLARMMVMNPRRAKTTPASAPRPAASFLLAALPFRAATTPPSRTAASGASRNRK